MSPAEANRQAFGRFNDEIRRCACLYPTQRDVAWLLAMATLREGFNSIAFASLNELTHVDVRRGPFAGLGANDLSLAVMGGRRGEKLVQGLKHFGIVVVDERARIEAAMPLTVWLLVTDSRQWTLPAEGWLYAADEMAEWQMHLRSCRRRHTASLGGLSVAADLHDARATVEPMAGQRAADAPLIEIGKGTATEGRRSFSANADAPDVPPMAGRDACASRHSESRNADLRGNARAIPKVGTPCGRASDSSLKTKDSRLKINLKSWSDYSMEQKKSALIELEDCNSDDRVRGLLNIILGDDVTVRDGGKWIKARWTQRAGVQRVMVMVVERLGQTHLERVRCTGRLAHSYAASCGVKFLGTLYFNH